MEARGNVAKLDQEMMETAVSEALKGVSKKDGGPFGAVVVKDGQIVSQGHNMVSLAIIMFSWSVSVQDFVQTDTS